jgi:hypothetical protein
VGIGDLHLAHLRLWLAEAANQRVVSDICCPGFATFVVPLRELSSVVKELAAGMGGSVAVASQPGAGATFAAVRRLIEAGLKRRPKV